MWLLKEADCVESLLQHGGLLQTLLASYFISRDIDPETLWIIYFRVAKDLEPAWDHRCSGEGDICSQTSPSGMRIRTGRSRPPSTSGNQMEKVVITQGYNIPAGEISLPPCGVRSGVVVCIQQFHLVPVVFAAAVNSLSVL